MHYFKNVRIHFTCDNIKMKITNAQMCEWRVKMSSSGLWVCMCVLRIHLSDCFHTKRGRTAHTIHLQSLYRCPLCLCEFDPTVQGVETLTDLLLINPPPQKRLQTGCV